MDIDSFVVGTNEQRALPDADGVVRREVPVSTLAQGDGGTLKGIELGAKLALSDFTESEFLQNFGGDINYTHSPGESTEQLLSGGDAPFPENSENVFNFVVWYESDNWEARLAYNYRSERLVLLNQSWHGLALYQDETAYLDAGVSYKATDNISVFLNASNITDESERFYLEVENQEAWENTFEPRYTLGIRGTF